jgi:hypothetical protein
MILTETRPLFLFHVPLAARGGLICGFQASGELAYCLLFLHCPVPLQHWLVCRSHSGLQPGSQGIWKEALVFHWGRQLPGEAAADDEFLVQSGSALSRGKLAAALRLPPCYVDR